MGLETARRVLKSRFASRQTEFVLGDFVALADKVTLDRVVCCYPDDKALLEAAAARARRLVAFTYPRNRWYVIAEVQDWGAREAFSQGRTA